MYKKSNQNIMIVLLLLGCIIMSILLIFPGLVMNSNDNINDLEENNNIEEVNVEGNYVDVIDTNYENIHPKLTSQFVKNTINLFNNDFTGDYFGYYFKQDKILVKDMDKKVLLNLALQKFANELSISKNNNEVCVNKDEIIKYSKTIFYNDVNLVDVNDTIINDTGDFYLKGDKYCGKLLTGKDFVGYNIYQKIIGYNKGSIHLQIFTKFTFCQVIYNEKNKEPDCVYRNTMDINSTNNIIDTSKFNLIPSNEIFNKGNTYKYTFLMKNDNLYFISVEKAI